MPKIVDHAQKRAELLERSFHLFARRGYAAVTMREIAKELQVSTGTLYHYFPNKEALFEQMVEQMIQRDVVEVRSELKTETSLDAKLRVMFQFVRRHEDYFQNLLLLALDFLRQHSDGSVKLMLQTNVERYRTALEEELELKDSGVGAVLFSFLAGLVVQGLLAKDTAQYDEQLAFFQHIAQLFSPSINPTPTPKKGTPF